MKTDTGMTTLEEFKKSRWNLVIYCSEEVVFTSSESDLRPLVDFLHNQADKFTSPVIFDKYTGRAAAMLMVLVKPEKVYTPIISEGAIEVFQQHSIPFEATETVKYLMGVASDGMCQWEKKALGKSPEEFWKMIKPE